jgi:hypothetical protein
MPTYRLNSAGTLKKLTGIYRLASTGAFKKVTRAYRLNNLGNFKIIFSMLKNPIAKSGDLPKLYFVDTSNFSSTELAYSTYKMYLTRGAWTEDPISFSMKIQRSTSAGFTSPIDVIDVTRTYTSYFDSDKNDQAPINSANRPSLTNALIRAGNYYRGYVEATNGDGLTGNYPTQVVKPRIDASVDFTTDLNGKVGLTPTANGATFSWTYSGLEAIVTADVVSQTLKFYPQGNTSGAPLYTLSVTPGTLSVIVSDSSLSPSTSYTVTLTSVMNDLWQNESGFQTLATDFGDFTTTAAKPPTPTNVTATDVGTNRPYNNGAVSLSWTQPTSSVTITGYKIEAAIESAYVYFVLIANTGTTATSGTFTGLDANKNYKFIVTALSATSPSDPSAESNVVLITTVPNVPTGISATAGNAEASVFFTAPSFNGGKSITFYRATSTPGSITSEENISPITVTGLTNYTSYTFTVAAKNANGFSAESSASNSVTPVLPAPVGSGTVTIALTSPSTYVYNITSYGTWSNSATTYDYQWQTSVDGSTNWTTRSSDTDVATIPNYDASAYKTQYVRLRVFGRNQTGPAIIALVSTELRIFYTTPIINTFTVTGNIGSVSYTYTYSADDPAAIVELEYKLSSASWPGTYINLTNNPSSFPLAGGTYDFRLYVSNSLANGASRLDLEPQSNIVVIPAPSASGFARSDSTTTPTQPSTITFSSSNNNVTSSWTNGSPITSVVFSASGAGSDDLDSTDNVSPFITSYVENYTSTGTYTATVTNINNVLQVTVSWNQANAQSYTINYSSSNFGADSLSGNASGSSVSVPINWTSGAGSFTFTGLTVYSSQNQQGTSTSYSTGLTSLTPTQKSSNRTNNVALTFIAPTASGFARSDSTVTPSQPSTITFSSSNNQVTSSWSNGSPITSVRFQGSGAGVNTDYSGAPFTSDVSAYTSSATYTATVTNTNSTLQVNVSWSQTNVQSYKIHYNSSVFGTEETQIFNDSVSSVSRNLSWSTGQGIFTFQGVTVYTAQNGGGTSNFFTTGLTGITPSAKTSSRQNSVALTYVLPNLITNPAYGTPTSVVGGFDATISTQPNPTGGTYTVVSATNNATTTINSSSGALTVRNLSAGQSSTVTVNYNRSGYNPVNITASGSATSNVAPFNGSATISLQSGTAGRVGAVYNVSAASASGTPTPSVTAYQWQFFNLATSTWSNITSATSSSYQISYGNSTYSDIGRTIRCRVTFSNGVSPDLDTPSNSITVALPTITSITSSFSTTSPFCVYRVFGYNMQAITTKAIINGSQQSGNTVSGSTNNDPVTGITRNVINGGDGSTHACIIRPEAFSGGGGALGTTVTTNTLTNNATNRTNSPVTNTFTAGGSV